MPPRVVRKIVLTILVYLTMAALLLIATAWVSKPLFWVVLAMISIGAIYMLDMMIPGINVFSRVATRLPKGSNAVALTFDDGPVEPYTREILDILDRFEAKASFFVIGDNVDLRPDLTREILRRGHTVASHTKSHRVLPFLKRSELVEEVRDGAGAIERACGARPRFFRCTKGYKSARVVRTVRQHGMEPIGFSYPIFDVENPPAGELVERVLSRAQAGDIILMHDGFSSRKPGQRDSLVKALPEILEELKRRGLRFVALDEILPTAAPTSH